MNINLVYEGKSYNFDIPNGVTIDYIKELSSKIFNSDKSLLCLLYNSKKVENKDDNTLLRDLIPEGETNTIFTVQINKDLINNNNEITPLVSLKSKENNINDKDLKFIKERKNKNKKNTKINEINNSADKKIIHMIKAKTRNNLFSNENNNNVNKKGNNLKIFQSNYIKKNKELLEIMKEFNNKIKDIHLSLYKKYRHNKLNIISDSSNSSSISSISIGINNNYYYELSIFEKKLLNFQEKQIKYYKNLLELLKKYEKNKDFIQLNNFYTYLLVNSSNPPNIKNEDFFEQKNSFKYKKLINKLTLENNNKLKKTNLSSLNLNNDNHLPLLKAQNVINSSLNMNKNNVNFNLNNISSINSSKASTKQNILKNKIISDREKDNNNDSKTIKNIVIQNKSSSNNTIKNNNNLNNNEKSIEKEKNKISEKSSVNSDNESEKDLVEQLKINENKTKIAPIPLKIRNSMSNNLVTRKFSIINNKLRSNSIIKNNEGLENIDKFREEKKNTNIFRYSSYNNLNCFNNNLKCSPIINKKITQINEITPYISLKKGTNDSSNEIINIKKIKDIDISSMTINDSNFFRDKLKYNKKKNNKDMNKYDFFV